LTGLRILAGPARSQFIPGVVAALAACVLAGTAPPLAGQALLPGGAPREVLRWSVRDDTTAGSATWAVAQDRSLIVAWLAHPTRESRTELRVQQGERTGAVAPSGWCWGKPAVAATGGRGAAVAWPCRPQREAPAKIQLLLVEAGMPAGSAQGVGDAESTDEESDPSVAACAGRILVAWAVRQGDGGIAARLFDAQGKSLGPPIIVDSRPAGPPRVACGGERWLLTWSDGQTAWTRAFDRTGSEAGPKAAITSRKVAGKQILPAVAMDEHGAALFVWMERSSVGHLEVFGRRFDPQGLPSGADWRLDTVGEPSDYLSIGPCAALDSRGNILVAWQAQEEGTATARTFGRIVSADRWLPIEAEFALDRGRGSFFPAVASEPGGGFLTSWTEAPEGAADPALRYGLSWRQDAASHHERMPTLWFASAHAGDEVIVDVGMPSTTGSDGEGLAEFCPAAATWR
jgi:hypothetical protein